MDFKKTIIGVIATSSLMGCATLTEDAMTPVALTFSDGSNGTCKLSNKRGAWTAYLPETIQIRKSDDALKYDCETTDGREAHGSIESEMGGKIIASAVFLDFGITDAITDKHRKYAASFVIPIKPKDDSNYREETIEMDSRYQHLEYLHNLKERGLLTEEEYLTEKEKVLNTAG